jgi:hypothetical protein
MARSISARRADSLVGNIMSRVNRSKINRTISEGSCSDSSTRSNGSSACGIV